MNDYQKFLETKRHSSVNIGIEPVLITDKMFDFQKHISIYAIKKGRCAVFVDTGLGKTIIELTIAQNYVKATNKPALIITPLAVASQFLKEANKFEIGDISYSKDGSYKTKIVVCNYERLEHFNHNDFDCVILDESSILKNYDGAIKKNITSFLKKVKYRYLFTATPSPNDYIELGTSSEALGYLGYTDMLTKFFKNNNNTIKSTAIGRAGEDWYIKPHAEKDFWRWIASWSISMRKPSDLGFSDTNHILPDLTEVRHIIKNTNPLVVNGQYQIFNLPAQNFFEIRSEVRATINERCEKAVEISTPHDVSVYWVNLNDESSLIKQIDKNSVEIRGDMDIEHKEEILNNFTNGGIKKLITKTTITAFGLNWQHCNHTTYFPTYSYEQYYQAIRRFWRFGQKNPVIVDLVLSDGQERIMESLLVKKEKAINMFESIIQHINTNYITIKKEFINELTIPPFMRNK